MEFCLNVAFMINSVDREDVIFYSLASISSAVLMVQHRSAT